jgi:hypothetical protein
MAWTGLLANAMDQTTGEVTEPALSRADSLPQGICADRGIGKHLLSYHLSGFTSLIRPIEMQAVRVGKSHVRPFGVCRAAKPVATRPFIAIKTRNHVEEIPLQTVVPRS